MATYPHTPFAVQIVPDRDRVIVAPAGELDLNTADEVWEQLERLRARGFDRIVLDLRSLSFIDSSGLRVIARAREWSHQDGFEFALIAGDDAVCRVLELTGLSEHLQFTRP